MTAPSYIELVSGLPRPAPAEIEAFVRHVADAENWLKSLASGSGGDPAGARLAVFLDPNAGARINLLRSARRFVVENLEAGAELLHGSELPTREYRASLGSLGYWTDLGAGAAELQGDLMRRAHLPEPGIVHREEFVRLPEALGRHTFSPGPFLHGSFRAPSEEGSLRRFRYAVERLPRLEGISSEDPLLQRIEAWRLKCRAEDEAGFAAWLAPTHGESPDRLDEPARWRRYVEWRDEDACTAMHRVQDRAFLEGGIPEEVIARHERVMARLRDATHSMLRDLRALEGPSP